MAHGTLIGGAAYGITGGKCLVGGTTYSIKKGRTLISGTGYDILFAQPTKITINGEGNVYSKMVIDGDPYYGNEKYVEFPIGQTVIAEFVGYPTTVNGEVYALGVTLDITGKSCVVELNGGMRRTVVTYS